MKQLLALSLVAILMLVPLLTYANAGFRLTVAGDFSCKGEGKKTVTNIIRASGPDAASYLGDLSYDKKSSKCFLDMIKPIPKKSTTITIGNHDSTEEKCKKCTGEVIKYLNLTNLKIQGTVYYTKFFQKDNGTVEIFVLDSQKSLVKGSTQYNKLKSDLAASDAWYKVIELHKDVFGCKCKHELVKGAKDIRDLAIAENVDLVLEGHNHNYQRSEMVGNTTFIDVGTGGKSHYALTTPATGQPKTVKAFDNAFGYLQIDFAMADAFVHAFNGTFVDNKGSIKDTFNVP